MQFYQSKLLRKYFVSYFCVLMIPLIVLGFFVFDFFAKYIERDIVNSNLDMLSQVQTFVDLQIEEINNISYQVAEDYDLSPYLITSNASGGLRAKQAMQNYKSNNSFIHEMFLNIRNDSVLYSNQSTYTIERYMNTYRYRNWSVDGLDEALEQAESRMLRPAEPVAVTGKNNTDVIENYITYIVPIPANDPSPYGTVMYLIKEQTLLDLLEGNLASKHSNTFILDNKGEVVSSFIHDESMRQPEFLNSLETLIHSSNDRIVLNGKEYLFSSVQSKKSDWQFVNLMPTKEMMKQVSDMKWWSMTGLVLLLVVGSAVIFYMSFKYYRPIRKLKEFAATKWEGEVDSANEIEAVRYIVDHLSVKNRSLSDQIATSRTMLRDRFMLELLKGQIYDVPEFNARAEEVQLTLAKPFYTVVYFRFHRAKDIDMDSLIAFIDSQFPSESEGCVKENMEDFSVILLLGSEQADSADMERRIEEVKKYLNEQRELQVTIGVGNRYPEPDQIGKSYMEALTAIHYRLLWGNNKIIYFNQISDKAIEIEDYPKQEMERLGQALKREDFEAVSATVGKIADYIRNGNISVLMARSLCYDVVNSIIKTMFEINASKFVQHDDYPDVNALLQFETVEELESEVRRVCRDILERVKDNKVEDLKTRIVAYIEDQYCNPDFSVQQLADVLNVSASYLSRYFKEQSGQSLTDYVNGLRIAHAERLLTETDDSLQQVVLKVGYYDVSSFIRKFKSALGVTPGEYRKLHKEQK